MKLTQEHNTKLSVKLLRETLTETIGHDLMNEGFSIDSNKTKIKKKIKKNLITVFLDCYDFLPAKIEFRLLLIFRIHELDAETKLFYDYLGEDYTKGKSFILSEGDFHPKVKAMDHKQRNAATHIVSDFNTLKEGIDDCRKILSNEIIPQFANFSELNKFQNYILNHYEEIIRLGLIIPGIIAAELKSKDELFRLTNFLWEELELETASDANFFKKVINGIKVFSEKER